MTEDERNLGNTVENDGEEKTDQNLETVNMNLIADVKPAAEAALDFKSKDYKYEAFISYRHIEPDATIASKIHTMIETFKVPKEFSVNGKRPQFRVFRDREELTTTSLSDSIHDALQNSKYLVVICSKRTKESEWCLKEVSTFIEMHGSDRIIPVLIEGEPSESFPPQLLTLKKEKVNEDGTVTLEPHEILAAEMRPLEVQAPNFEGYASLEKNDPTKLKALTSKAADLLKTEKYRIMAAILNMSYGDLKQRDKERRTRLLLMVSSIVAAARFIFGVFMVNAYNRENIAKKDAIQNNSALLLNSSRNYLTNGDRIKALMVADLAMKPIEKDMKKFEDLKNQHMGIINDSVYSSGADIKTIIDTQNSITNFDFTSDGSKIVAGYGYNQVGIWDAENGALIKTLNSHTEQISTVDVSPDGKFLATGAHDKKIMIWDPSGEMKEPIATLNSETQIIQAKFTDNGKYLLVISDGFLVGNLTTYDTSTWKPLNEPLQLKNTANTYVERMNSNPDGSKLLVVYGGAGVKGDTENPTMVLFDLKTNAVLKNYPPLIMPGTDYDLKTGISTEKDVPFYFKSAVWIDENRILAANDNYIVIVDAKTGTKLKQSEKITEFNRESKVFSTSKDKKSFYINKNYSVDKYDTETLKLIESTELIINNVKNYNINDENELIALHDDKTITYAKNGKLESKNVFYGNKSADVIVLSPDKSQFAILSKNDMNIKLVSLSSSETVEAIEGQVARTSSNGSYTLMYGDKLYYKRNNKTGEMTPISEDVLGSTSYYFSPSEFNNAIISDDGTKVVVSGFKDKDGNSATTNDQYRAVVVYDLATNKELFEFKDNVVNAVYDFTMDSKSLVTVYHSGDLEIRDSTTGEVKSKYKIPLGYIYGVVISDNMDSAAINYAEGNSSLISLKDGKQIKNLPGKTLYITHKDNGTILTYGVYNNYGLTWSEGEDEVLTQLPPERIKYGENLDRNIRNYDFYNPAKGLLMSIRSKKDANDNMYVYLTDFKSGVLLKTFTVTAGSLIDMVYGFISPDGKSIVLDNNYLTVSKDTGTGTTSISPEMEVFKTSLKFDLLDYDTLLSQSSKFIKGRTLSDSEMKNLGIQ
ncbi:MAG: TIR domain-containing protein [Clostridiaceae bacterium]